MSDSIFNRTIDKFSDYKPLPVGEYLISPTKYEGGESSKKKTPFVKVHFRIQQALSGQDVEGIDFKKVNLSRDFYLTDNAQFILNDTLKMALGLDKEQMKALTLGDALEQFIGTSLIGIVDLETNTTTGKQYRVIKTFRPAA